MDTQSLSDDLRRYAALLWHWAWLIVLAALLSAVGMYLYSKQITPVYQVSSTLMVNQAPGTQSTDYAAVVLSERLTQTYAEMLTKQPVLEEVVARLGLDLEPRQLKGMIAVQPIENTQLIDLRVVDTDPNRAAAIANEVGTVFAEQNEEMQEARYASTKASLKTQLDEIQRQIDDVNTSIAALGESPDLQVERDRLETLLSQYRQTYSYTLQSYEQVRLAEAETLSNVIQAEAAEPTFTPIRPKVTQNTLLAGIVGAMLAVGVIFLIEVLDDTIRGPEEVKRYLDLPVLGVIRKMDEADQMITIDEPRSPVSEAFRSLRTNFSFTSVDNPLRSILITSAGIGEGKTVVAANLSVVLAQGGNKVTLVDTDLRRPRLHRQLKIPNRRGLTSLFMRPEINLDGAAQDINVSGLSVITSGNLPPNPAELLGSDRMRHILETICQQSDIVVLDSPPVIAVTDAVILSQAVDGVLLVVQPGKTKIAALQKTVEQIKRVGANIIGVVLNNVGLGAARYSYYYYYYSDDYYGYQKRGRRRKKKS